MAQLRVGPLVRAVSASSIVIWAEMEQACNVTLQIRPQHEAKSTTVRTFVLTATVGGRHYIAPQLQGLQAGTWYSYYLSSSDSEQDTEDAEDAASSPDNTIQIYHFRTLDAPDSTTRNTLRIAYGSCHKAYGPAKDALHAFDGWLARTLSERETQWPHVLLLIGDQIYADEPTEALIKQHPQLKNGAHTFEDFALMHEYGWTNDPAIRQLLASIPSYMIFDDHDVTNNFNMEPTWRAKMLQTGMEQTLVDGMVAYWIYQGWGNLTQRDDERMPLLHIMCEAARSGEDALEALRASIKADIYGQKTLPWHYEIPTTPAIFVANARTERTSVFSKQAEEIYAPTRIASREQMGELRNWVQAQPSKVALVVSSVPVLLPPVIGLGEYIMGQRIWHGRSAPLRWLGRQVARVQQAIANKTNFDHWPLYPQSWRELVEILRSQEHDLLVLSGDVHFSYAMRAQLSKEPAHTLYQFVSTPLQNGLTATDRQKIELQSSILSSTYGGLQTRMLRLKPTRINAQMHNNLLFENTLALVTLQPMGEQNYRIQQTYLGIIDGQMDVSGQTIMPDQSRAQA